MMLLPVMKALYSSFIKLGNTSSTGLEASILERTLYKTFQQEIGQKKNSHLQHAPFSLQ